MAEIRKHRPTTSAIGDQVRAAVGTGPRPVDPGEVDLPEFDPFFTDEGLPAEADQPASQLSAASLASTGEWFVLEFPTDQDAAAADAE